MKKLIYLVTLVLSFTSFSVTMGQDSQTWSQVKKSDFKANHSESINQTLDVTRFWSNTYKGHFYTANAAEAAYVDANYSDNVWLNEGRAFSVWNTAWCELFSPPPPGICVPVYRFWSETYKHHFYTISESEKNNIQSNMPEWHYEGVVYSADNYDAYPEHMPLYRFWSSTYKGHFYTADVVEKEHIIIDMPEWNYEGIAYYVLEENPFIP